MTHWGGYFGIATAAVAWYASFAGVVNETFKKAIIPTIPLAPPPPRWWSPWSARPRTVPVTDSAGH